MIRRLRRAASTPFAANGGTRPYASRPLSGEALPAVLLFAVAATLATAAPAWAVIPGLTGPLQALSQMLPQVLPFLAAGLAGALGVRSWRERCGRVIRWLMTGRGIAAGCLGLGAIAAAALINGVGNRSRLAVAAPAAPASGRAGAWSMFRGNLARTGAADTVPGPKQGKVHWAFSDPEARVADLSSSPAVAGNRVYAGSAQASVFDSSGMVYCLDAKTGKLVWRFQTDKQVFSSPSVVNGRVYVGEGLHVDTGCKVYCLDAATGKKLWSTATRSHTEASPAVIGDRLYIGAGEDGVYCLSAATGKPLWHRPGMHIDASPAVANGRAFVGTGYGKLRAMALDAATGKTLWEAASDLPVWGPASVVGGSVYFGIGNGDFVQSNANPRGAVWRLDAATGKTIWRRNLPDAVLTASAVQGGKVYAGCRDGRLYALDAATGKPVWSADCGGPVVASPALDAARVFAAGGNGRVLALDLRTGAPAWSLDVAGGADRDVKLFSSPALANGRLYLGTSKEKFLCIGP